MSASCPVVFVKDSCLSVLYARLADHKRLQTGFTLYLSSLEQFLKADTVLILQKRKLKTP